jgi:chromosome segregation ATPase
MPKKTKLFETGLEEGILQTIPFLPKLKELMAVTSGNLDDIRKLKSTLKSLEDQGLVKSPAAKKIIGKIEKIIIKHEHKLEKERLKQLREDYSIKEQKVMKEIMQEQQELAEHLKTLRMELEGFFEKGHKELEEIKARAEKVAELQKQLDVVKVQLQTIRSQISVVNVQINTVNQQIAALGPQMSGATISSATTQLVVIFEKPWQDCKLPIEMPNVQQIIENCVNDLDRPPTDSIDSIDSTDSNEFANTVVHTLIDFFESKNREMLTQEKMLTKEEIAAIEKAKLGIMGKLQNPLFQFIVYAKQKERLEQRLQGLEKQEKEKLEKINDLNEQLGGAFTIGSAIVAEQIQQEDKEPFSPRL